MVEHENRFINVLTTLMTSTEVIISISWFNNYSIRFSF